jgi:hypothetical protein
LSRIFICYSRVDLALAERLAHLLRKAYDRVWYDDNLHGGEEWWAEVLKEIATSEHFLLLMSEDSLESEWCQKELAYAGQLKKHIVPVMVRARTEVPEGLQRLQRIDMEAGITVEGINQLYATLIRHDGGPGHTDEQARQRITDRRVLERLWPFIDGRYVEILGQQVQNGRVDWEQYTSRVGKYLDLRSKPHSSFASPSLEEAFEAFDDTLIRLDGQIGWTYMLEEINGRSYFIEPIYAISDSFWGEKYAKLLDMLTRMWVQHVALTHEIRKVAPDFDLVKDY